MTIGPRSLNEQRDPVGHLFRQAPRLVDRSFTRPMIVAALLSGAVPLSAGAADLGVVIEGLAHARGAVYLALYDRPETFLDEAQSRRRERLPAALPGPLRFAWRGLAPGDYAVTVYHDENGNGRLDRLMGVAPAEGFGLSNNPQLSGRPGFELARVRVPGDGLVLWITLRYPPPPGFDDESH